MRPSSSTRDLEVTRLPYALFLVYIISFFVHIPARIPVLGAIRFDLLLVASIFALIITAKLIGQEKLKIAFYLKILFVYIFVTLPLVTWPGTALKQGIPDLVKATIFFLFTYTLVLNEQRFKTVVYLFLAVNTFRVIEPLYLNITQDYWGSRTSFGWEKVNRLAGAPHDVINGNGLAFVIATILPFYHYLFGAGSFKRKLLYWAMIPVLLYTMSLTLSRSGMLAIAIIYGMIFLKSKRKALLSCVGVVAIVIFFGSLSDVQKDRYLSIVSSDTKSSGSAEGRIEGWFTYLDVALVKPIFGHGLGASAEANWNYAGSAQLAHNLWLEVFQELGLIGLIIFILYVREIYRGFKITQSAVHRDSTASEFLKKCLPAMQVWLAMNFLFSFASYGLTSYEWYLFGGFSAVITRLTITEFSKKPYDVKRAEKALSN